MAVFRHVYRWAVFHCVYYDIFNPIICRRTLQLSPCLGRHEQCCNEHRGAYIFANKCFQIWGVGPRRGIAGSCESSSLNFLRSLYSVFQSGCASLHSHQHCEGFPFLYLLFSIVISCLIDKFFIYCKYLLPFSWLHFCFVDGFFCCTGAF